MKSTAAIKILKKGGLIVYPTETAYALGCDATNKEAIKKVYMLKKRNRKKPLTAIVSGIKMAKKFGKIGKNAELLIKKFMPGPLTLIVNKKKVVPDEFNSENFGFRISSNKIALELCKKLNKPIVSTSANFSGKKPEYSIKNLIKIFGDKIDLFIDAGRIPKKKVSTIVDLTGKTIKIVREGEISKKEILSAFGK